MSYLYLAPALLAIPCAALAPNIWLPADPPQSVADAPAPEEGRAGVVPGESWEHVADLATAGWSADGLEEARVFATSFDTLAVMVVENGEVVASWGDIERTTLVQSVRKSFMNAIYGLAVERGQISLDATLAELDVDDIEPALTDQEKQATVRHLLQSRSGIYHDAATTPAEHLERRPPRGTHTPGEHWFYNNWDFNVLGTIYEQATGMDVFEAFKEQIADPIGMQDFDPEQCEKRLEDVSLHPAHHFSMSARDIARFGQLYIRQGEWNGRIVLPASWIEASTTAYSGDEREGYGYLWWVQHRINGFAARGGDSQLILVVPDRKLVFVTQSPRHAENRPGWQGIGRLLSLVLRAKTDEAGT